MGIIKRFLLCLPVFVLPVAAGTFGIDAGPRATIYDDNFKLGLGGALGVSANLNSDWAVGVQFNYTHFRPKTANWTSAEEYAGSGSLYYLPKLEQPFTLKLGPHLGYSYIRNHYIDVGADLRVCFPVVSQTQFYLAFIPGYFIGKDAQALVRVGIGAEYHPGL